MCRDTRRGKMPHRDLTRPEPERRLRWGAQGKLSGAGHDWWALHAIRTQHPWAEQGFNGQHAFHSPQRLYWSAAPTWSDLPCKWLTIVLTVTSAC